MAKVVLLDRRKRCRWCERRTPRVAINHKGYAIVTSDNSAHWSRLTSDGWRKAAVTQLKDHREVTFLSPTRAWVNGAVLRKYLLHPVCAAIRHRDVMNGL